MKMYDVLSRTVVGNYIAWRRRLEIVEATETIHAWGSDMVRHDGVRQSSFASSVIDYGIGMGCSGGDMISRFRNGLLYHPVGPRNRVLRRHSA